VVTADSREDASAAATAVFTAAARTAGLPAAPVVRSEAVSEEEEAQALENEAWTDDPGGPR
jgi:hypothetical protein